MIFNRFFVGLALALGGNPAKPRFSQIRGFRQTQRQLGRRDADRRAVRMAYTGTKAGRVGRAFVLGVWESLGQNAGLLAVFAVGVAIWGI